MRQKLGPLFLIIGLALTTACGGPAASNGSTTSSSTPAPVSATGAQQITITVANRVRFEPSSIVVRAGLPVELTLRNEGEIPHDFTLADGVSQPVKIVATGGQTTTGTFTLDRAGTYTFICSVPGHEAAGMKGTITAQ